MDDNQELLSTTYGSSIEPLVTSYLEWLRARAYATTTLHARRVMLAMFCRYVSSVGIRTVEAVSSRIVQDYQVSLEHLLQHAPCLQYSTLCTLRRFFQYAVEVRGMKVNPCRGLQMPNQPNALPRLVLSYKQARRILATPNRQAHSGIRNAAILELFYSTGIRLQEMSRLSLEDVDLTNGLLQIRHAKFSRSRVVPIGTKATMALRAYLDQVRTSWSQGQPEEQALWLSAYRPHHPIRSAAICQIVRTAAKAAGIRKPVSPHIWRHTCASHLVARGAPLPHVQRLLGHQSLNTTQVYARVTVRDLLRTFHQTHPRALERKAHVPDPSSCRTSPATPAGT